MAPTLSSSSALSLLNEDYRKVFTALVLVKSKPVGISIKGMDISQLDVSV